MPPLTGGVELQAVTAVVADAAAPKGVVEIDDHEFAARGGGSNHGVGQQSEQRRCAVGMKGQLRGVVKAVVEPASRADGTDQRRDIEECDARHGEGFP